MVEMASQNLFKEDDAWQIILAEELMEKSTITPRTLSILKDKHEYCDPNILMNLRHKSTKRMSYKNREPSGTIMEVARRNLKTEYKNKASGAVTKKLIDNEVEKFKQRLTYLKRINASSSKLPIARKPSLKARFQKITMRTRSCGSNAVKVRRNKIPECVSMDNLNLPETKNTFFDLPPQTKLNWVTASSSAESLNSDTSLPAVYGNSLYGRIVISQRGPNTTAISQSSEIYSNAQGTEQVRFSHDDEYFPDEFHEKAYTSQSPGPPVDSNRKNVTPEYSDELNETGRKSQEVLAPVVGISDTSKAQEKKRKVKNSVYKQFMSYVCSKTARVKQLQNIASDKPLPMEDVERAPQREEKIALVLDYLQRKKNSPDSSQSVTESAKITSKSAQAVLAVSVDPKTARASGGPYEHRFQAQRDLIKRQKMQLEEQQRKIEALTLAQLQEEAKTSHKDFQKCIDELEENCTSTIKPHLKGLRATGSQPDFSTAGKIVERMEKRAKEREEKKQLAAERRKLMEEERKKKMAEEEEKLRKEEEEKKREAFEKIRDEQIRQREIRERTRKEQEKMLDLQRRAEEYNKHRLCKTAFRAFKKLLVLRDEMVEKADWYYKRKILRTAFLAWQGGVGDKVTRKLQVADSLYKKNLMRNSFDTWKKEMVDSIRRRQVAEDMYELRLQERVFRHWGKYVNERRLEMAKKLEEAEKRYSRMLLKKAFCRWRAYPKIAHLEREKEQRKTILRQKVKDMLPDFRPISPQY